MQRLILIPVALLLFVVIYPFAEYNFDCPSAVDDPIANENCTYNKMMMWEMVSVLSLTEYGFPSDCEVSVCWWKAEINPDAYDTTSIIPLVLVIGIMIATIKIREYRGKKLAKLDSPEKFDTYFDAYGRVEK